MSVLDLYYLAFENKILRLVFFIKSLNSPTYNISALKYHPVLDTQGQNKAVSSSWLSLHGSSLQLFYSVTSSFTS